MRRRLRLWSVAAAVLLVAGPAPGELAGTKHDFWLAGGGPPGGDGGETCVFCHAPHSDLPSRALWNRAPTNQVYTPYSSSSMQARPGQPTGSSKLCLSCHDGTIAIGAVASRQVPIGLFGNVRGRPNLGTDLSDDHPVSFVFDSTLAANDQELRHPSTLTGTVRLDMNGEMQCTSCHDAHSDFYGKFLVKDASFSGLCTECHDKRDWSSSSHSTSSANYAGIGSDPWPETEWNTVSANGCSNCHTTHAAGHPETLLRFTREEDNCIVCHDGSVAALDVAADLSKPYRHPVDSFLGVHQPDEEPLGMPWHVECHDCHDPHGAASWTASAPGSSGPLNGASGVSIDGNPIENAQYQYEVCLRCHGDNAGGTLPAIDRQNSETNLRLEIRPDNASYHPLVAPGRNSDVPSLRSPWFPSSLMYCTDCHASDDGPGAGGPGPAGPHGSRWPHLLERQYSTADGTPDSDSAYALCYKCHDHGSILSDSSFPEHRKHIEGENSPCSVCHDPHGVSSSSGDPNSGTHLINFDISVVTPDPDTGLLQFEDLGTERGRCYLSCHGEAHSPQEY